MICIIITIYYKNQLPKKTPCLSEKKRFFKRQDTQQVRFFRAAVTALVFRKQNKALGQLMIKCPPTA